LSPPYQEYEGEQTFYKCGIAEAIDKGERGNSSFMIWCNKSWHCPVYYGNVRKLIIIVWDSKASCDQSYRILPLLIKIVQK
jgi:hypothetical protein